MQENRPNNLKNFFIKLISISFAVIIIINVVFNLILGDRIEKIDVSLRDIYNCKTLNINLNKKIKCTFCKGTGGLYESSVIKSQSCDGKGKCLRVIHLGPGMNQQSEVPCDK